MGKVGRWAVRCGAAAHSAVKWCVYCLAIALVGGTVVYALFATWLGLPTKQLLARVPVTVSPEAVGVGVLLLLVLVVTDTEDSGIVRNELGSRNEVAATNTAVTATRPDGGSVAAADEEGDATTTDGDTAEKGEEGSSESDVEQERSDPADGDQEPDAATDDEAAEAADEATEAADASAEATERDDETGERDDETATDVEETASEATAAGDAAGTDADEQADSPASDAGGSGSGDADGSRSGTRADSTSADAEPTDRELTRTPVEVDADREPTAARAAESTQGRLLGRRTASMLAVVAGVVTVYLLYRVLRSR